MIAALTNHLWQSTMFAVVAALLATALRENRARVRHGLWAAASFKFFVPFALLVSLGRHVGWSPAVNEITAPAVPAVSLAMARIAQPFSHVFPSATAMPRASADWAAAVVFGVWACGFAAIGLTRWRGWQRIEAAVRTSTPLTIPNVRLQPGVQVRSSPGLLEPGVVGWWRPILLVPGGIGDHLTPPQLEAVLAHELCHVRRRDNLTAAIHMIVETAFWFHPLVWWIGAHLVDERERACDEHVLGVLGQPRAYAEGILNVCRLYVESPLACVSGVTGSHVKQRIEDIMINRIGLRLTFARKAALALAATVALAVPIVAGMMTVPLEGRSTSARQWTLRSGNTSSQAAASIRAKEAVLKENLLQLRNAIDKYYVARKQYARDLDSLVSEKYIDKIPTDPFTNRADSWRTIPSRPDPNNPTAARGIYDVRSGSSATAVNGTKYSDW